jgi:hypothetical protein
MNKVFLKYSSVLLGLLSFSCYFSCSKKSNDPSPDNSFHGKLYVIAQGAHETTDPFVYQTIQTLTFKAKFDSSAIYKTVDSTNQFDTNKLYGFSDCGTFHQTNSARFGWRWVNGNLEIMAYCYINGIRPEAVCVDTVALNAVNTYKLEFKSDRYIFSVNDSNRVEVLKSCNYSGLRYKLYPYFGGNEVAPHEIKIWIEEL